MSLSPASFNQDLLEAQHEAITTARTMLALEPDPIQRLKLIATLLRARPAKDAPPATDKRAPARTGSAPHNTLGAQLDNTRAEHNDPAARVPSPTMTPPQSAPCTGPTTAHTPSKPAPAPTDQANPPLNHTSSGVPNHNPANAKNLNEENDDNEHAESDNHDKRDEHADSTEENNDLDQDLDNDLEDELDDLDDDSDDLDNPNDPQSRELNRLAHQLHHGPNPLEALNKLEQIMRGHIDALTPRTDTPTGS